MPRRRRKSLVLPKWWPRSPRCLLRRQKGRSPLGRVLHRVVEPTECTAPGGGRRDARCPWETIPRGKPFDMLACEGCELRRRERWRDKALAGFDVALEPRADDSLQGAFDRAPKRIGEPSMENEWLCVRAEVTRVSAVVCPTTGRSYGLACMCCWQRRGATGDGRCLCRGVRRRLAAGEERQPWSPGAAGEVALEGVT